MNPKDMSRLHDLLRAAKTQTLARGDEDIAPNRVDATTSLDEDARALNEMHQILASRQNQSRMGSLAQINRALQRLADDPELFGCCLECEEPIGIKRLDLMPHAEYCVQCQGKRDAPRVGARRKLTDFR